MASTDYPMGTKGNGQLQEQANAKLEQLKDTAGHYLEQVEGFIRERPATALMIAVGAGFLIGRLVRR